MISEEANLHRPSEGVKAKMILEEERIIAHTQNLEPSITPTLPSSKGRVDGDTFGHATSPTSVRMKLSDPVLRIGVLGAARISRKTVAAIQNPVSLCTVTAVASREWQGGATTFIEEWCRHPKGHDGGDIVIKGGEEGYTDLIESKELDLDAIYIPQLIPTQLRKEWVLKSLESGKHVLIEFPASIPVSDYVEMIAAAKQAGKLLMDGTGFVHHDRFHELLSHVSSEEKFGPIRRINAEFCVKGDDKIINDRIWLSKHDDPYGCVGSLGWFCARMAVVVFSKVGVGSVTSVQVTEFGKNKAGHPLDARCVVNFDKGCTLSFHCSYAHPTMQQVEIIGENHSATMQDFAFPHDTYTSFQVHETPKFYGEDQTVATVDAVECRSGPLQEVMMWRKFASLCRGIDNAVSAGKLTLPLTGSVADSSLDWGGNNPASKEANDLVATSVQTQVIIDALMESIRKGGAQVTLPIPELYATDEKVSSS